MSSTEFTASIASFEQPLELLKACHARILLYADLLLKLNMHISSKGIDQEALTAINRIQHYFSTAAAYHHQDEENDLFPMLIGINSDALALVESLENEHLELDGLWQKIETILLNPEMIANDENFEHHCHQFLSVNQEHIEKENEMLLPMAEQFLSPEQLTQLGKSMAARRNIKP